MASEYIKTIIVDGVPKQIDYNALANLPENNGGGTANVEVDNTLSIEGAPADAKATGDRLNNTLDLSSAQEVTGVKTFTNGIKIGSITLTEDTVQNRIKIDF